MGKRIKQFAPGCATRSRLMRSWDPGPEAELLSIPLVHPALPGLCKACQAHEQIVLSLLISLVAGMTAMQCTNAGDYHRDSRQNKERGTRRKQGIHLWASTQHRKGKGGCLILKIAMWAIFAAFGLHHILRSTGRQQHFPRCPAAWWQAEMLSQDLGDSSHRALRSLSTDHFPSHSPCICKTHRGTGELGSGERWLCQHMLLIWHKSSPSGLSQRGLPLGSHGGRRPSGNYSTRSSDTLLVAQRDKYPAGGSSLKLWHPASQGQQKCFTARSFWPSAWSKEHHFRTDGE